MRGTRTLGLSILLSILLLAGGVSALPMMTIDVAGGDPADDVTADGTFSGPDVNGVMFWSLDQSQAIVEGGNQLGMLNSWTVSSKEDPYVTNNVNLTNTTGITQTYMATVLLPIPATAYNAVISSSVGATITDSNGNNSMALNDDGFVAFYRGQVNGGTLLNLSPVPLTGANCSPFPNQPAAARPTPTASRSWPPARASRTTSRSCCASR